MFGQVINITVTVNLMPHTTHSTNRMGMMGGVWPYFIHIILNWSSLHEYNFSITKCEIRERRSAINDEVSIGMQWGRSEDKFANIATTLHRRIIIASIVAKSDLASNDLTWHSRTVRRMIECRICSTRIIQIIRHSTASWYWDCCAI